MKRFGLALGGGGARGLVHIGVLKVLAAEGIQVDCLAGTSMGGVIGCAFAAGKTPAELEQFALDHSNARELMKLVDLTSPRRGLLVGQRVRALLASLYGESLSFEDLAIPAAVCAVDMNLGRQVAIHQGPVLPAVVATSSVPGLFPPMHFEHPRQGTCLLVDGGVLNNVPADIVRQMGAEVILAVDPQLDPAHVPLSPISRSHPSRWPAALPELLQDLSRTEMIMVAELTRQKMRAVQPEVYIQPPIPPEITMFLGFPRAAEVIRIGEVAALGIVGQIEALVNGK